MPVQMPVRDEAVLKRRSEIVRALRAIVPDEGVISAEREMRPYESDGLTAYRQLPLVVVLPRTIDEVSRVLRYCHSNAIKVVPRGAGTRPLSRMVMGAMKPRFAGGEVHECDKRPDRARAAVGITAGRSVPGDGIRLDLPRPCLSVAALHAGACGVAHRLADLEPPTNSEHVRATLRGIRRTVGAAPARKAPVLAEAARAMALSAPDGLKGLRDRALLLLGFAGAFRRSELVALDVADLEETEDGFKIIIRRSKTDQEGHGVTIAIARGVTTCPVKSVKAWLQAAGITEGPLFRPVAKGGRLGAERLTDQSVCSIVKAYAERIGLKAADFGAHSLRAGFLTSAARRGASVFKMRDVSRHKSMDVLQAYVRDADLFRDHAGAGLL